jgi:hypothetical protein
MGYWALKPWWCQPWSIIATGVIVPALSWITLQRWWVTIPVVAVVLAWWILFLLLAPAAYRSQNVDGA